MFNVIECLADYCPLTSGYRGVTRIMVATHMTLAAAEEATQALLARNRDMYDGGDFDVVVEGVKSDLAVMCAGDHWSKVILDTAANSCHNQPCYYACAVSDVDWDGDGDAW